MVAAAQESVVATEPSSGPPVAEAVAAAPSSTEGTEPAAGRSLEVELELTSHHSCKAVGSRLGTLAAAASVIGSKVAGCISAACTVVEVGTGSTAVVAVAVGSPRLAVDRIDRIGRTVQIAAEGSRKMGNSSAWQLALVLHQELCTKEA